MAKFDYEELVGFASTVFASYDELSTTLTHYQQGRRIRDPFIDDVVFNNQPTLATIAGQVLSGQLDIFEDGKSLEELHFWFTSELRDNLETLARYLANPQDIECPCHKLIVCNNFELLTDLYSELTKNGKVDYSVPDSERGICHDSCRRRLVNAVDPDDLQAMQMFSKQELKSYSKIRRSFSEGNQRQNSDILKVAVPVPVANELLTIGELIVPTNMLYFSDTSGSVYGREGSPHITIGVDIKEVNEDLSRFIHSQLPIKVKLVGINEFDQTDYKVVKFDVESEELQNIYNRLLEQGWKSDYPDYTPHITIAYVKSEFDTSKLKFISPDNPIEFLAPDVTFQKREIISDEIATPLS